MSRPDGASAPPERAVRVGIGLIERSGCYLVRRRPPGTVYANYWEFPGGKCEEGESPEAATRRECLEETGMHVSVRSLRRVISHRYPHARVEMFFYDCVLEDPRAEPEAGTGFRWARAEALPALAFPEANGPILEALARAGAEERGTP